MVSESAMRLARLLRGAVPGAAVIDAEVGVPGLPDLTARRFQLRHPERDREQARLRQRRYQEVNPNAGRARARVRYALLHGTLERQPCARCGGAGDEAHHPRGYLNALDVVWYCRPCHRAEHTRLRRERSA